MSKMNTSAAHQIWLEAAEIVKDHFVAPTLFTALEAAVGIAIDGDEFILGFSGADLPLASHLRSGQQKSVIENCISQVMNRRMRVKIIEGTTEQDYENYKRMVAAREAAAATVNKRREAERRVENAWEEVAEKISRGYAKLHLRQFAQSRAKYVMQCYALINEAANRLGYSEDSDEIHQRAFSRVWEKFSVVADCPSVMLAYEFFKLREEGKLPTTNEPVTDKSSNKESELDDE